MSVSDSVTSRLNEVDGETACLVKRYERDHKGRAGVIQSAEQRIGRQLIPATYQRLDFT